MDKFDNKRQRRKDKKREKRRRKAERDKKFLNNDEPELSISEAIKPSNNDPVLVEQGLDLNDKNGSERSYCVIS